MFCVELVFFNARHRDVEETGCRSGVPETVTIRRDDLFAPLANPFHDRDEERGSEGQRDFSRSLRSGEQTVLEARPVQGS